MSGSSSSLRCWLDVPTRDRPRARYALEMLLAPLGIHPEWVDQADLEKEPLLYYGATPPAEASAVMPYAPGAWDRLQVRTPLDPAAVAEVRWDGECWPLPFGTAVAPDLLASSFYWLSGWQEGVERARDTVGRVRHVDTLQAALGTTVRPAVDAYRELLATWLSEAGVPVVRRTWGSARWALCPTHDIDYLRKWRPGIVLREAVLYPLLNLRGVPMGQRLRRLGASARQAWQPGDPCRHAFERMHAEVARRGGTATYFIKAGAHGPYDVAYATEDAYLQRRLEALRADGFEVGLHPSFHAHTHAAYLKAEREALAAAVGAPVTSVRQHYLRYQGPLTSRLQAAQGFTVDSTLGFAEHEGFRHGTCHPFRVYDLERDQPLPIWEYPLAVMESTLFNRRHLDLKAAIAATEEVLRQCQRFGGVAVMLWHNTLWDELDYPGWGAHFLATLDAATARGGRVLSLAEAHRSLRHAS
ncbi:MAG: polysaccharide deacetylase family protein [Bacteroidota bacterium]